jgi:hypothetical protein
MSASIALCGVTALLLNLLAHPGRTTADPCDEAEGSVIVAET